jgi:predicted ATPase
MFTQIEAQNFKCFKRLRLELAPITILVGPNGSGKSSVLESIALLAQSTQLPKQVGFKWQGPWVDFGTKGEYAFKQGNLDNPLYLGIALKDGVTLGRWQNEKGLGPEIEVSAQRFEYRLTYTGRTDEWSHELLLDGVVVGRYESKRVLMGQNLVTHRNTVTYAQEYPDIALTPMESPGNILSTNLLNGQSLSNLDNTTQARISALSARLSLILHYIGNCLRERVFLVGVERAFAAPKIEHAPELMRVGKRGDELLPVLAMVFASNAYKAVAQRIRHWAGVFGLKDLVGGWTGGATFSAEYIDEYFDTNLPTRLAGFGSQQVLPIIAQLFGAPKGSLIMIEEPEISLHPDAQVHLLEMFVDAVRWGQQILLTTHSQTLLLALSTLGRQTILKPDDLAIYHFSRDGPDSYAGRLKLNERWYVQGWVPSFAEVEERLMKDWMENVRDRITEED